MAITLFPNDEFYFGVTAVLTIVMQLFFFCIAYGLQFDKVTDFAGSTNFVVIALLTFFAGASSDSFTTSSTNLVFTNRQLAITLLVCISRMELAAFLLYRVIKRGKDDRFDAVRGNFVTFFIFWIFQMIWAYGVSLPVIYVNADQTGKVQGGGDLTASDWVGIVLWVLGFAIQVAGDVQKYRYRSNPANKEHVCNVGMWHYSRHPNFFGEILLWWGIFVLASGQFHLDGGDRNGLWGYFTILSPLLTMLILLLGSGMPTAEGTNQARFIRTPTAKLEYLSYRDQTSPLVPLPPAVYLRLPLWCKRWFLFEWTMYEMNWDYVEGGKGMAAVATTAVSGEGRRK